MRNVLRKIPVRKVVREKGKSFCVIAAVFFTTMLFVMVFTTLFFVMDAADEMMRRTSPMLADAVINVTDGEYERICNNGLVSETGRGIRLGEMTEPSGAGGMLMFALDDRMAQWMRYYPTEGRMPEKDNEIVVSGQYLKDCGLTFALDEQIELTYYVGEEEYKDVFNVVGKYDMAGQPMHVVMVSDDFYEEVCSRIEISGMIPEDGIYQIAGVMFSSRGNVRKLASRLIAEEGLEIEEGEIVLNDISLLSGMGTGVWMAILVLLLFVMMIGYLFISNIFQISISGDARFYGKLSTNGVTKREIRKMIRRGNHILFLLSAVPALLAGYAFSAAILPGILNACTTLTVRRSGNAMIFILSLAFSYATVMISERKSIRLAKNASPIEMKKYMGKFRQVKTADNRDCLKKFTVRNFKSNKAKVVKVCISVALSIFLANTFYTVSAGFDEEEYGKGSLDADFIIAKEPVFTNVNLNSVSYPRTTEEEIMEYKELPGIKNAGGASLSHVCIHASQETWETFVRIAGEDQYEVPGEMWTSAYGLDDMMLQKLKPIQGEIDPELFHTGNYILLNPIVSDNNGGNEACYRPGDKVTIPFRSGETGTYTVMAVVESLPLSLNFPGRYAASELYLPMREWQEKEGVRDYYLYAFDVEEEFRDMWDGVLESSMREKDDQLTYRSASTVAEEARGYISGLKMAGFALSMILLTMGILNFINCMTGSVYNRRKEFAVLQSMGLEEKEIRKGLAEEGLLYMAGGFVPGVLLAVPGVYIIVGKILTKTYIKYRFYPVIYLLFAVLGSAAAVLVPWTVYAIMDRRENFLSRIRACRE